MPSLEEETLAAVPDRQIAKVEELRFDISQGCWWDTVNGKPYTDARSVNNLVPRSGWSKTNVKDAKTGEPKEIIHKPSDWTTAENNLIVNDSIWWPGKPTIIEGFMVLDGEVQPSDQRNILFNTYRPPVAEAVPHGVTPDMWISHIKSLWPIEAEHNHFFDVCAHMVQRPEEKANGVIALSGEQGIGKDMALEPVRFSIGGWNAKNVSPEKFLAQYNPFVESVMLTIEEMRAFKEDFFASAIYDKLKSLSATPPNTTSLDQKYMKTRHVINVMRIFITTNNMTSLYIHANDRRFVLLHSTLKTNWQPASYFTAFKKWMVEGGNAAVAQWLRSRDISQFEPKKNALKTAAGQAVAGGWAAPDDAVARALAKLDNPDAFFTRELIDAANGLNNGNDDKEEVEKLNRSPRKRVHRLEQSGYYRMPLEPALKFEFKDKTMSFDHAWVKATLLTDAAKRDEKLNLRGNILVGKVEKMPRKEPGSRAAATKQPRGE